MYKNNTNGGVDRLLELFEAAANDDRNVTHCYDSFCQKAENLRKDLQACDAPKELLDQVNDLTDTASELEVTVLDAAASIFGDVEIASEIIMFLLKNLDPKAVNYIIAVAKKRSDKYSD